MNSVKVLARVGQLSVRNIRQSSSLKAACEADNKPLPQGLIPAFYKLKEDQKLYQQPDGIPVHFKRGARDKILCGITVALLAVGLAGMAEFVYHLP